MSDTLWSARQKATWKTKLGLAEMLKGGVIMDVTNAAEAKIAEDAGAIAKQVVESGRVTVHLPASPLMHGTGAFTSLQAMAVGGAIVTLESRTFDPHELWRVVEQRRVTQMAIVGDAFAKPMLRALDEAGIKVQHLELNEPSLDDVFAESTGYRLEGASTAMTDAGGPAPETEAGKRGRRK